MAEKNPTLEESFKKLEEIVNKMEQDDISLEDSFALYNDGMKVLKNCNDAIDTVEKKLMILNGESNNKEEQQ